MAKANPAQLILDTIPAEAHAAQPPAQLPEGVQAGHAYAYRGAGRMGTCWATSSGRLQAKANGGLPHSWAEANAHALTFTHAVAVCGCA